jgi:hypothetical protein
MVTSFLIATMVLFVINIILNLILLGAVINEGDNARARTIGLTIIVYLIILTWNIFALVSL